MTSPQRGDDAVLALHRVTSALANFEERVGQDDMTRAIADAISDDRLIVVQAGTGTGKSLGYLVPIVLSGKKTVVATATKALQDQLHRHDLPFLREHLGQDFEWAVVKGRSNYVCLQKLDERQDEHATLDFDDLGERAQREVDAIAEWAHSTTSGDLEELPTMPSDRARKAITATSDECPGQSKCPRGQECFAERARRKAHVADVIVVNLHLYGLHVASGGAILPPHEVVVFDEVHQLENVMSDTVGVQLTAGRLNSLASSVRAVLLDVDVIAGLERGADGLRRDISGRVGTRITQPLPASLQAVLSESRIAVGSALTAVRGITTDNEATKQRQLRAQTQAGRLADDIDFVLAATSDYVAYVEGTDDRPVLKVSPLHVGPTLATGVWHERSAVLTSATVPTTLPVRVGLPDERLESLSVPSPFNYEKNSRLYCSPKFPDRNSSDFTPFVHAELEALITAAGGRTLALFTSTKAMNDAVRELRDRIDVPILTPTELPRHRLIDVFMHDESSCIFASQSFFQGVDLPGRTLSLVVLDKLPFPRPDDPLLEARREAVGRDRAFTEIDLPIAATAFAQAAGRLIRSQNDRGVVAVLDRRLATASYWRTLIGALPPMSRTRHREEVEDFLRAITAESQ
jgi:ATP-dependent DNA helicase DinG